MERVDGIIPIKKNRLQWSHEQWSEQLNRSLRIESERKHLDVDVPRCYTETEVLGLVSLSQLPCPLLPSFLLGSLSWR